MSQAEVYELHPPITVKYVGERGPIYGALAKAQGAFQPIERTKTVHVKSSRAEYDFDYAPLDEVLRKTVPALSANGLAIWSVVGQSGDDTLITCVLSHESGSHVESTIGVSRIKTWWQDGKQYNGAKSNQEVASDVTYWKRQLMTAQLGVCADADDDGAAGEDLPRTVTDKGPRQGTQPKPPAPKTAKPVEQSRPQLVAVKDPAAAEAEPSAPEEMTVTAETKKAMIPLLKELGMATNGPLMAKWSTELIGVPLDQLRTEAHGQILLADLRAKSAAAKSGSKEAS